MRFLVKTHLNSCTALLAAFLFLMPATSQAQDKVLAKIDGVEITEKDLAFAQLEIGPELTSIPEAQRRYVLLEFLIENQLLSEAAKKQKIDAQPDFSKRVAYYTKRALRDVYFDKNIRQKVTEETAKKEYDKQVAEVKKIEPKEEIRASHILVKTEKEAKDIVSEIKKGGDFAKIAKEKSTGPSKVNGGDLGFFTKGRMVPAFEKAAFALKKDEVSAPVKSKFGWHVIKLVDKRKQPLPQIPEFNAVKDRILRGLLQQQAQKTVQELRKAAKIEVLDKDLEKQMKATRGSFPGEQGGEQRGSGSGK